MAHPTMILRRLQAGCRITGSRFMRSARAGSISNSAARRTRCRKLFHTEMHKYLVNGQMHIANDRDPQIPEALAPVVMGIASLHDFRPRHQSILGRFVSVDGRTHKVTPVETAAAPSHGVSKGPKPEYTFPDPNDYGIQNEDIAPYDFAAIYNLTPLWTSGITGKGVSIAIASQTDINLSDVATFRKFFGLSKFAGTAKQIINGADPGTVSGDVTENTLDTEWSGATAPDANVITVASKSTATTDAATLSINYIIDNEVAPIMSASYGACEASLGKSGNASLNAIFQQGSAEGISLFESSGDQGSTGCDPANGNFPQVAEHGAAGQWIRLEPLHHGCWWYRSALGESGLLEILDRQHGEQFECDRLHSRAAMGLNMHQLLLGELCLYRRGVCRKGLQRCTWSRLRKSHGHCSGQRRQELLPHQYWHVCQLLGSLRETILADGRWGAE